MPTQSELLKRIEILEECCKNIVVRTLVKPGSFFNMPEYHYENLYEISKRKIENNSIK
jgi:hypothetical protein